MFRDEFEGVVHLCFSRAQCFVVAIQYRDKNQASSYVIQDFLESGAIQLHPVWFVFGLIPEGVSSLKIHKRGVVSDFLNC